MKEDTERGNRTIGSGSKAGNDGTPARSKGSLGGNDELEDVAADNNVDSGGREGHSTDDINGCGREGHSMDDAQGGTQQ